jgi:hypothetical protein
MAPLNPNNTGRFWLAYTDGVNPHEMMVRYGVGADLATIKESVHNFLTTQEGKLYLITILGARFSGPGSNVSSPTIWTGSADYGTGEMPAERAPFEGCFLGRTSGGRRMRLFLYGLTWAVPGTFRIASAGGNEVETGLDAIMTGQDDGVFWAIDNLRPTMYTYMDVQYNSYWEEQARG